MSQYQKTSVSKLQKALGGKLENIQNMLIQVKKQKEGSANSPKNITNTNQNFRAFVCQNIPRIKFSSFLKRFTNLGKIPIEILIHAYILFNRSILSFKELKSAHCSHKLFTSCVFLSYKFLVDSHFWAVGDFCKLGGISKEQLQAVETILLSKVLKFELYVSEQEFTRTENMLSRLYSLEDSRGRSLHSGRSL